jgi:hypothetical protein
MRFVSFLAPCVLAACTAQPTKYADAAIDAARWIRSTEIRDELGSTWPADPNDAKSVSSDLYAGSAGVVLFFVELAHSTGDASWLDDARRGADRLIATLPASVEGEACGLYTGVAGVGFALEEMRRATGDERYRAGALRCLDLLANAAIPRAGAHTAIARASSGPRPPTSSRARRGSGSSSCTRTRRSAIRARASSRTAPAIASRNSRR